MSDKEEDVEYVLVSQSYVRGCGQGTIRTVSIGDGFPPVVLIEAIEDNELGLVIKITSGGFTAESPEDVNKVLGGMLRDFSDILLTENPEFVSKLPDGQ